ncbi:hypothetical protein EJB05_49086 [Eragrostis curvula]|uniref:Uncharacterized protein n=1 Tax=Eragrostis curvula TaxID=38414 RepID=A0A5J9T3L6_9POAL|nr:hypothetical protein EJB05_49086 [Eragrostis curvula]
MAAVADRAQAVPSPPSGLAPEPLRSRLAQAVADAVACAFLASAWVFFAAWTVLAVGRLACEGDCPVKHAALIVTISAAILAFVVCPVATMLLIHYTADSGADEAEQGPAPEMGKDSVCFVIFYGGAFLTFFVVAMVGVVVNEGSHVKGCTKERVGLAMMGLGILGNCGLLPCLVLIPALALDGWRRRRAGWRWCGKFVGKPSRAATAVMMGKEPQALSIC